MTQLENLLNKYPLPVTIDKTEKILNQMKNNICKIENKKGNGTGFFCKIFNQELLITNNHVIDEEILKNDNIIKVKLNDGKKDIKKYIKIKDYYTSEEYDTTIMEIEDESIQYLEIDDDIFDENIKIFNESIYIIQYPKYGDEQKASVSYGILNEIQNKYNIIHYCSTDRGSSGSPILKLSNQKIIGIHKEGVANFNYNRGTLLNYPINEYLNKISNEINLIVKIKKEDINKDIYFLDNTDGIYYDGEHHHDNLRELNELNTKIFINNKKYNYKKSFKPEKEGLYEIKIKLYFKIKDCSYMFCGCSNIINIDLSSFDTKKVSNMSFMFYNCSKLNLIKINNISLNIIKELEYTNANIIDQFGKNISKNNYINNNQNNYLNTNYMMNNNNFNNNNFNNNNISNNWNYYNINMMSIMNNNLMNNNMNNNMMNNMNNNLINNNMNKIKKNMILDAMKNKIINNRNIINKNKDEQKDKFYSIKKYEDYFPLIGLGKVGLTPLNSILQCLLHIPKLNGFFFDIYSKQKDYLKKINKDSETAGRLCEEYYNVVLEIFKQKDEKKNNVVPKNLYKFLCNINEQFTKSVENDSKDLLLYLLKMMHKELNYLGDQKLKNTPKCNPLIEAESFNFFMTTKNNLNLSIISYLFYGILKSATICQSCNTSIYNFQFFKILSFYTLKYKDKSFNIYQGFKDFCKPELMTCDNQYYCPSCKSLRDAKNTKKIYYTPPYLIINIDYGKNKKYKPKNIDFGGIIDIIDYVDKSNKSSSIQYRLIAVISDNGGAGSIGNYITYCQNNENKWYVFNNSSVTESKFEDVYSSSPCILIYKKLKKKNDDD